MIRVLAVSKHRICVFAGSRDGTASQRAAAGALGRAIARRGWGVVYGGAGVGAMGILADAALAGGGEVLGVIPSSMVDRELAHPRLTQLTVVKTMHERKAKMHELSDAFLSLPGGFGTLDETFETLTWMQLELHDKPIGMLDVDGYWQPLLRWIERAVADGLVRAEHARQLRVGADVEGMLDALGPRTGGFDAAHG
jgi:uncharacterized protein (TIGR00730 family)